MRVRKLIPSFLWLWCHYKNNELQIWIGEHIPTWLVYRIAIQLSVKYQGKTTSEAAMDWAAITLQHRGQHQRKHR